MRAFFAFTKKEFTESVRTYRLIIMLAVFLIFGVMSPLFAKLMPVLLKNLGDGFSISVPEPTAMDSWAQFFKNVGQMGAIVLVIIFAGIVANEFSRGTLVNILTKGMKRQTVILSKFTTVVAIWTLSYMLSIAVTFAYTVYFWGLSKMHNAFLAFLSLWLFGILLITLLILGGTLFKTFSGSLLLCGGGVVVMTLLNIIPKLQKYNPVSLSSNGMALLTKQNVAADFIPAVVICAVCIFILMFVSITVFNKKEV